MKDERNCKYRYEIAQKMKSTPPTKRDKKLAVLMLFIIVLGIPLIAAIFDFIFKP